MQWTAKVSVKLKHPNESRNQPVDYSTMELRRLPAQGAGDVSMSATTNTLIEGIRGICPIVHIGINGQTRVEDFNTGIPGDTH